MTKAGEGQILSIFEEALELLTEFTTDHGVATDEMPTLPSLLELCEVASERRGEPPLRTIHHFACTGGTVISKCIAALPGAVVLSEIDPLSRIPIKPNKVFAPTDLILALRQSVPELPEESLIEVFTAGMRVVKRELTLRGYEVVIRDHAHSQFATDVNPASRATLLDILTANFPVIAVLTVRHPLDSFISLTRNGWLHFNPPTLDEYCRRYIAFLDRYSSTPVFKYEDFTEEPAAILQRICDVLKLRFHSFALDAFSAIRMSGDSGRSGDRISHRSRREVPPQIYEQARTSASYALLCGRLDYSA